MKNDRWVYYKDVQPQDMGGGVTRRVLAYSNDLMVVENTFEKGAVGSLHHHPHTQITYVKSGRFLFNIDGEKHEVKEALNNALKDSEIAVILITQKLITESSELVYDLKLNRKYPLIVEIPDRHGSSHISTSISQYVREAIGIRI